MTGILLKILLPSRFYYRKEFFNNSVNCYIDLLWVNGWRLSTFLVGKSRWPQKLVKGCVKPVEKVPIIHIKIKTLQFLKIKIPVQVLDDFTLTVPRDQWTGGSEVAGFTGSLEIYMKKYMDPCQVDPMMKMEKDLDETKIILHRSIEAVLERDEKLHDLVAKSDELSEGSKMFYKTVPKQGCCSSLN